MKNLKLAVVLPAVLVVCVASPSWANLSTGGSLSGSIAEYNAAQLRDNDARMAVPAGMITYTANTVIPAGTIFTVTLPAGMEFTSPVLPSLSSTDETFLRFNHGQTARFVVLTSDNAATSTITLGSYTVKDASALEKIVPVANALPITMQAVGIDPQPLSVPAFASDSGIHAEFVGAIQFIDLKPPSNGREFANTPESPIGVLSAIEISPQVVDSVNQTTPILGPDGQPNVLASYDTVTVAIPGALYGGINVFSSLTSECTTVFAEGKVTTNALIFPNIPLNRELFFCSKTSGKEMMKLIGFPSGGFISNTSPAFTTVQLVASHPNDDYLTSENVDVEYAGNMCYTYTNGGACINEYFNLLYPSSAPLGN